MRKDDGVKGCQGLSVKEYTKLKEQAFSEMKELFPEIARQQEEEPISASDDEDEEKISEIK